jgi:hypothetical protein
MFPSITSQDSASLLSAPDESLSSALALIEKLSLFNIIWGMGADLLDRVGKVINRGTWSSSSNQFAEELASKSREYGTLSPGERLLRTIGALQELLDVAPRDLRTSFDIEEVADDICIAAVKILREDTKSEKDTMNRFVGNDTGSMIRFQMTRYFAGLRISMEEFSPDQQNNLIKGVRDFLASLPCDQQRFIQDKLGAADLSEAAIRDAVASGAIWTAFAAAVQVFGFAFYTTAAHLLAIVSLGLLPFGAYVGLSSLIAVLASPVMVPIIFTFGAWYYFNKNRAMRQSMAPLLVTSLCLSGMEARAGGTGHQNTSVENALALWSVARDSRDRNRLISAKANLDRDRARVRLTTTSSELRQAKAQKEYAADERKTLNDKLAGWVISATGDIARGLWGRDLISAAARVKDIEAQISSVEHKRDMASGFFDTIAEFGKWFFDSWGLDAQLTSAKEALVQQARSTWPKEGAAFPENVAAILRQMEDKTSQILSIESEINSLKSKEREQSADLDRARTEARYCAIAQAEAEKRYYGLGKV